MYFLDSNSRELHDSRREKAQFSLTQLYREPPLCCDQWIRHMIDNPAFRLGFPFVNNLRVRWSFILRANDCEHRLPKQVEPWLLWGQGSLQDDPGQVLIPLHFNAQKFTCRSLVGLAWSSMSDSIYFDNLLIVDSIYSDNLLSPGKLLISLMPPPMY